jgi:immune inhibitor A
MIIDYDDPQLVTGKLEVDLGRARYTPDSTEDGVIVRLPDEGVLVENLAGDGVGWWSDSGDLMDNRVYRDFDLITATAPITFSFDAYWDIEEDWDYGFVEVSTDGFTTTVTLPDLDGILTDTDPNGNNLGWGLTGSGSGTLRFDLSAYAGQTIGLRFRYLTDVAVANPAWWVDNLLLEDDNGILYENDLDTDFSDWTNEGWIVVPFDQVNERYYLVEWRDDNGFDMSLNDPYNFIYSNPVEPPPESVVDRLPATTPGMLMAYRNTGEGFDYTLFDSLDDAPSTGPKFAHIVIESHFNPKRFDTLFASVSDGWVGPTPSGRALPGDATFGLVPTNEWTSRLGFDYDTGTYSTTVIETKTWPADPPIMAFHDSYGYYPGFFYPGSGPFVYYTDSDASAALPAKGLYTTRITDLDGNLLESLFGVPIGPGGLGTGNPGDDHVHYGLHVEVVGSSEEYGTIHIWNDLYEVVASAATDLSAGIGTTGTLTFTVNENIGGMIVDPYIVVELPDSVEYMPGSEFGGMEPVTGTFATAADVVQYLRGEGQMDQPNLQDEVRYMVWAGDDIGTMMGTDPYGFGATVTGDGNPTFTIWYFKDGLDLFQTDTLVVTTLENVAYLPIIVK